MRRRRRGRRRKRRRSVASKLRGALKTANQPFYLSFDANGKLILILACECVCACRCVHAPCVRACGMFLSAS